MAGYLGLFGSSPGYNRQYLVGYFGVSENILSYLQLFLANSGYNGYLGLFGNILSYIQILRANSGHSGYLRQAHASSCYLLISQTIIGYLMLFLAIYRYIRLF